MIGFFNFSHKNNVILIYAFRKRIRNPEPEFRRKLQKFDDFAQWVKKKFGIEIKDDQGYLYISDTNTIYMTDPKVDMQGRDIKQFIKMHK